MPIGQIQSYFNMLFDMAYRPAPNAVTLARFYLGLDKKSRIIDITSKIETRLDGALRHNMGIRLKAGTVPPLCPFLFEYIVYKDRNPFCRECHCTDSSIWEDCWKGRGVRRPAIRWLCWGDGKSSSRYICIAWGFFILETERLEEKANGKGSQRNNRRH